MTIIILRGSGGGGATTVNHGSSIIVAGSSYGSAPSFGFTGGATGQLETTSIGGRPADGNGWIFDRFAYRPQVGNDASRGKCFIGSTTNGGTPQEIIHDFRFDSARLAAGGRMIVTEYLRLQYNELTGEDTGPQHKCIRIMEDSAVEGSETDIMLQRIGDGFQASGVNVAENGNANPTNTFYGGGNADFPIDNSWMKVEWKLQTNTTGSPSPNGICQIRFFHLDDVPGVMTASSSSGGYLGTRSLTSQVYNYRFSDLYGAVLFMHGVYNGPASLTLASDDHYVGYGQGLKRCEIWSSLTPSSAFRRNSARFGSWSSGANTVDVEANLSGFTPGQTAYAVVLADNFTDTVIGSQEFVVGSVS